MAKRQSVGRIAAKTAARTQANRMITDSLGTGLIGGICKVLFSQAIKQTDKFEIHTDSDFGTTSIEKK